MASSTAAFLPSELAFPLFLVVVAGFAIFSLVMIYHWLRYAHRSWVTVPTMLIYGIGAAVILAFTATAFL